MPSAQDTPQVPSPPRLALRVQDESGTREQVLAGSGPFAAGRESACEVRLADQKSSRRHLEFAFAPDGWVVADLGSRNGIQVNGKKAERVVLSVGDVVAVGLSRITVLTIESGAVQDTRPAPLAETMAEQPVVPASPADRPVLVSKPVEQPPARPRGRRSLVAALVLLAAAGGIGVGLALGPHLPQDAPAPTEQPRVAADFPAEWLDQESRTKDVGELLDFYLNEESRLRGKPLSEKAAERAAWCRRLIEGDAGWRIEAVARSVKPLIERNEHARAMDLCRALQDELGIDPPPADLLKLRSQVADAASAEVARVHAQALEAKTAKGPNAARLLVEDGLARCDGAAPLDALVALRAELSAAEAALAAGPDVEGEPDTPTAPAPEPQAPAPPAVTAEDVEDEIAAAEPDWHRYRYADVRARLEALAKRGGDKVPKELTAALEDLADEEALFQRLIARLGDASAKPVGVDLTDQIRAHVTKADAERFGMEGGPKDGAPGSVAVEREWGEVSPLQLYELFLPAVDLKGAERIAIAAFLWNHRLEEEAMDFLVRAHRSKEAAAAADELLARRLGIPVPEGGFVEAEGVLMTPDEKKALVAKREEEKKLAEEEKKALDEDLATSKAAKIAALAEAAEAKGDFARAKRLWLALAERLPDSPEGKKAKERLASVVRGVVTLVDNGPSENRFDIAILGDGYTIEKQEAFLKVARRMCEKLFREEPFKEYEKYFNVRAVCVESKERGFDIVPGTTKKDTALGAASEYDLMTVDHGAVHRALKGIPDDGLAIVLVNGGGTTGTGGGGVLAMGASADAILHHEIGHAMAGLGDEYETKVGRATIGSASEAKRNREGFEKIDGKWVRVRHIPPQVLAPNLMRGSDPEALRQAAPWRHWIERGMPNWRSRGMDNVDVFEGGGMKTHDVWRPQLDCRMRDASSEYCVVCMEQMVLTIYRGAKGIDRTDPPEEQVQVKADAPAHFQVKTLAPRTHSLEVEWTIRKVIATEEPEEGGTRVEQAPARRLPGGVSKGRDGESTHYCEIAAGTLTAGVYEVEAIAKDPTPYVLLDAQGRLTSKRSWRVEVK